MMRSTTNASEEREYAEVPRYAATGTGTGTSTGHGSAWSGDSDWVLTSQTPDSLLAITPPGGEGSVWVQVAASFDRQMRHARTQNTGATRASVTDSPLLIGSELLNDTSQSLQPERIQYAANTGSAVSLTKSSTTGSPARTLDAHIEADLVASVAELLASAASTFADDLAVGSGRDSSRHTVMATAPASVGDSALPSAVTAPAAPPTLLQLPGMHSLLEEVSTRSPTLRALPATCSPPVLGTLTATLRAVSAFRRAGSRPSTRASLPASPQDSSAAQGPLAGTRSLWNTPPSAEADVQLVSGTAEMEALMASTPAGRVHGNSTRSSRADKQRSTEMSPPTASEEAAKVAADEGTGAASHTIGRAHTPLAAGTSTTNATSGSRPERLHLTADSRQYDQSTVCAGRQRRVRASCAAETASTPRQRRTEANAASDKHHSMRRSSRRTKNTGQPDASSGRLQSVRAWLATEVSTTILSATVLSIVLFGAGVGVGSWIRSSRCHCTSVAA
ncbi:hypothetical protein THASP1DRAFT_21815 [Thamnocephalis sphaerospora]|uniref:Transmembrane protein n=1 Tax=Thamnocephalis sphaerospora TaxID=78915 RepID=A0A4P9XW09_9FUNG|nr:hypothetical protein THASP1DRAFT_21815 [Thamnocephalis sphaerospora]|eukprot:RKP10495.1 hypothetical protein THASP1DRAFT_21815 [Thamnocephalis sphaerospora]